MKPGHHIIFDLETWTSEGEFVLKTITAKVLDIITDPLERHESKASVKYQGEEYGIPFSEIHKVINTNDQLKLKL